MAVLRLVFLLVFAHSSISFACTDNFNTFFNFNSFWGGLDPTQEQVSFVVHRSIAKKDRPAVMDELNDDLVEILIDDDRLSARANRLLQTPEYSPHRLNNQSESILRGDVQDEIVIVTHQKRDLIDNTVTLLQSNEFDNVPRVFLTSPQFPIFGAELLSQSSLTRLSLGGETTIPINARKIHLLGGFSDYCLCSTFIDVVHAFLNNQLNDLTINIHGSLTYSESGSFNSYVRAAQRRQGEELELEHVFLNFNLEGNDHLLEYEDVIQEPERILFKFKSSQLHKTLSVIINF